jgi:hypothetical protein
MTAATSLTFPPGRVLADWRRQLALQETCTVWIGHVHLHRIEALARIARVRSPDALQRSLLRALALTTSPSTPERRTSTGTEDRCADLATLGQLLGLDAALLQRMLGQAEREELVSASDSANCASRQTWRLTLAGSRSLEASSYAVESYERRVFHFLSAAGPPPCHQFLNISSLDFVSSVNDSSLSAESEIAARFADVLASCISQPLEWKHERGFPVEIVDIMTPGGGLTIAAENKPVPPSWQRVIVIQRVQGFLLFVHEVDHVRAFAARPEGWGLQAAPACLVLRDGEWQMILPQLREEPSVETWRAAWLAWGQSRSLPESDVRACEVASEGFRLGVRVGKRLMDRLRASRSEALTGEAWVQAGERAIRAVRMLEIREV